MYAMSTCQVRCNIEYSIDHNDKVPKYRVHDHFRIPKWKNVFAKDYTPNSSEDVFVITKVKKPVLWTCYYWSQRQRSCWDIL